MPYLRERKPLQQALPSAGLGAAMHGASDTWLSYFVKLVQGYQRIKGFIRTETAWTRRP